MKTLGGPVEPAWIRGVKDGTLDRRILMQDQYWVDCQGRAFRLEGMSTTYLAAVLQMLMDRAIVFHLHAMVDSTYALINAGQCGTSTADALEFNLTGSSICDVAPHTWLEALPLIRTMRKLLTER